MSVRLVPAPTHAPLVERPLWAMQRAERRAVALAREVPGIGLELVITIDGERRWAALYRGGLGLEDEAAAKRQALLDRGWLETVYDVTQSIQIMEQIEGPHADRRHGQIG